MNNFNFRVYFLNKQGKNEYCRLSVIDTPANILYFVE